jgi:glutamine synthetase
MEGDTGPPQLRAQAVEAVRASSCHRVKLAVTDVDGILRGKVIHSDRFPSVVDGGFGFNVFGCDVSDRPYDDDHLSGRRLGFPDAHVRLDPSTLRKVPWDDDVPFMLGEFVKENGEPHPLCPRQLLKRVLARGEAMGLRAVVGSEYEFFNFKETPETWAAKRGNDPTPITPGHVRLLAAAGECLSRLLHRADGAHRALSRAARQLHTRPGPESTRPRSSSPGARGGPIAQRSSSSAKEIGAQHGIMPSFMRSGTGGCPAAAAIHQSLSDGSRNVFYESGGPVQRHVAHLPELSRGPLAFLMEFARSSGRR